MSPSASCDLPEGARRAAAIPPIWFCTGWGLPCLLRYRRSGELLPRLFTLTCRNRRFFSVALSRSHLLRTLSGTLPCGVRTFLTCLNKRGYLSRFRSIIRDIDLKNQEKSEMSLLYPRPYWPGGLPQNSALWEHELS